MILNIDHSRINQAIAKAETTTSGEITCVLKKKAYDYPETPLIWAVGISFLAPLVLALFDLWPQDYLLSHLPPALQDWQASHSAAASLNRLESTAIFVGLQLILFALTYGIVSLAPVKLILTPRALVKKRAHEKAMDQFYARGLHLTRERTGVMIFCALQERYVTVIADEGIYNKVDKALWNVTVARLVEHIKSGDLTTGFETAIEACGEALSQHFPPSGDNPNELPDVLIEL